MIVQSEQDVSDYCRQIESYLCQKNGGHLIRVVGPSFERVAGWAMRGVPLKIAYRGIDRSVERYYQNGVRRHPLRIDFCEADVLDVFDEWRRATGVVGAAAPEGAELAPRRGPTLADHLERVLLRLTNARATGLLAATADELIDGVSCELDLARSSARGVRGEARQAIIERLARLDAEILSMVRREMDPVVLDAIRAEANDQLAGFREQMTAEAFARALDRAVDTLVRERAGLPTIAFK